MGLVANGTKRCMCGRCAIKYNKKFLEGRTNSLLEDFTLSRANWGICCLPAEGKSTPGLFVAFHYRKFIEQVAAFPLYKIFLPISIVKFNFTSISFHFHASKDFLLQSCCCWWCVYIIHQMLSIVRAAQLIKNVWLFGEGKEGREIQL